MQFAPKRNRGQRKHVVSGVGGPDIGVSGVGGPDIGVTVAQLAVHEKSDTFLFIYL